jgi:NAD(P)-dependent dehydrogenase (short-subunit alcohol dehydrogenase family)
MIDAVRHIVLQYYICHDIAVNWTAVDRSFIAGRYNSVRRIKRMHEGITYAASTVLALAGRTVLITGASSGLGMRFSTVLAKCGAKLALGARRLDRLEELVSQIEAIDGRAVAAVMDVTNEGSVLAAYDKFEAALGPIHTVIVNAGINAQGLATDLAIEDFEDIMSVNVRGAFLTAREGARRMIAAGSREGQWGRIVLIASIGGHTILPGLTAYCASKAAVMMMGRCMAREWAGRGINVNVVCPGYVRTEINDDWFESDAGHRQIAGFPRKRLMNESDLDAMIVYLSSDAARSITGASITIDDAQSL